MIAVEESVDLPLLKAAELIAGNTGDDASAVYTGMQLAWYLMRFAPEWWAAAGQIGNADKPREFEALMRRNVAYITAAIPLEITR